MGGYGLFVAAVLLDTLGTTLFKVGANQAASLETVSTIHRRWYGLPAFLNSWHILLGLIVYAMEYVIWITYLSSTSLSHAFPMYSLTIVLVLIVSRCLLKEQVRCNRWLGAILIIAGVCLLGGAA